MADRTCFVPREKAIWDAKGHFNFVQESGIFYIAGNATLQDVTFDWPLFYLREPDPDTEKEMPVPPYIGNHASYCRYLGEGCPYFSGGCDACSYYQGNLDHSWCSGGGGLSEPYPLEPTEIIGSQLTFEDGEDIFSFPAPSGVGTIQKVSVHAYHQGKGQTVFQIGAGDKVYGYETSTDYTFDWNITDYLTRPDGTAWSWSDLAAGTLTAGIRFFRYTGKVPSKCRCLKVVIEKLVDGATVLETLWPSADVACSLVRVAGTPLSDSVWADTWRADADVDYPLLESSTPVSGTVMQRYIMSDLPTVPPRFSIITSMKVSFVFRATSSYGTSYARTFIEVAGTKYYGTTHYLGSNIATTQEYSDTWATNPATSAAWDYDDYKGVRFGVHYFAGGNASVTTMYLYELDAETTYQEQSETVEYIRIAEARVESYTQYPQNPIQADDLILASDVFIPERAEILYINAGARRFQGLTWTVKSVGAAYRISCKSQQIMLDYRYLPSVSYQPKVGEHDETFGLDSFFGDETPTHPYNTHMARNEDTSPADVLVMMHESPVGLLYLLNSAIPLGNGESSGRVPNIARFAQGRPCFAMDRLPVLTPMSYLRQQYADIKDAYGEAVDSVTSVSLTACHPAMGSAEVISGGPPGGLLRLYKQASTTCTDFAYAVDDQDLYLMPWPDQKILLCDHAVDMHIRRGYMEGGNSRYINTQYALDGQAAAVFDDLFQKIGYELQFLPRYDGNVTMSAAIEISRGTSSNPLWKFVDGQNCQIKQTVSGIRPDIVVGQSLVPQVSTDWARKFHQQMRVLDDVTKDGSDLKDYLDALREEESISYEVTSHETNLLLRVGDWIWVDGVPVRCRQITETPGKTVIKAGQKLFSLNEQWGIWRNATGAMDVVNTISWQLIDAETFPYTQTFTVRAKDYARGDWKCRLSLDWQIQLDLVVTVVTSTHSMNPKDEIVVTGDWEGVGKKIWRMGTSGVLDGNNARYTAGLYDEYGNGITVTPLDHPTVAMPDEGLMFAYKSAPLPNIAGNFYNYGAYGQPSVPGLSDYIYIQNVYSLEGMMPFFMVALNGRYLPPGKIYLDGKSGEIDIDISDYVNKSEIEDKVNTVVISLHDGFTKAADRNVFHRCEGKILQQRKVMVLDNA